MEKEVNDIINRIMKAKDLNTDDLNEIIKLHKIINEQKQEYKRNIDKYFKDESYLYERQIKRLEMSLRDKLKQINVFLSDDYLNNLESILFYKDLNSNIKDIRLINKREIAIIRENSIELGNLSHNVDSLSEKIFLQEEIYIKCNKGNREYDNSDPKEIFSNFYKEIYKKINILKESLNIMDRDVKMYFDRNLGSLYFDNLKSFRIILTELPNIIEIYEINVIQDKWIPKKINGDLVKDFIDRTDCSLLKEYFLITDLKRKYKVRLTNSRINDLDIEMVLNNFKQAPFSLENLINTYNNLFNNDNCIGEENESTINRLKYITTEKCVQQGLDYEKAFSYSETIFKTIQVYKTQVISAINGNKKFPKESLVKVVKKLKYPTQSN